MNAVMNFPVSVSVNLWLTCPKCGEQATLTNSKPEAERLGVPLLVNCGKCGFYAPCRSSVLRLEGYEYGGIHVTPTAMTNR